MVIRDMVRTLKGWLGVKVHGYAFNIDIVDGGCPVSCPSCAVGSIGRRPRHLMTIEMFRAILDKAQSECKVRNVQTYAYSEPTMHPDLHLFLEECRSRKIPAIVSTVLQGTRCDWEKVIEARPREIRISFPGWKHMSYYQKGADPNRFNRNFETLMFHAKRYPETTWTMGYHIYKDTIEELPLAMALADRWCLKFVPLQAIHMENTKNVSGEWTEQDRGLISRLIEPTEEEVKKYIHSEYCNCQSKQITISATGIVWLCQLTYTFPLGDFLKMPFEEIRRQMMVHPFCPQCKAVKGNVLQEKYGYFFDKGDPVEKANKGRMKT